MTQVNDRLSLAGRTFWCRKYVAWDILLICREEVVNLGLFALLTIYYFQLFGGLMKRKLKKDMQTEGCAKLDSCSFFWPGRPWERPVQRYFWDPTNTDPRQRDGSTGKATPWDLPHLFCPKRPEMEPRTCPGFCVAIFHKADWLRASGGGSPRIRGEKSFLHLTADPAQIGFWNHPQSQAKLVLVDQREWIERQGRCR